jgi:cytidine deaminase
LPHLSDPSREALVAKAREVRLNAYAPYSNYSVGAALESSDGKVWVGANVENVSFGATLCAERAAVLAMVAGGSREIKRLVLSTRDGGYPCGLCLQVLLEFSADPWAVEIVVTSDQGGFEIRNLHELIPFGFSSSQVRRT